MKVKMNISEFKKFQELMNKQLGGICEAIVSDGSYSLLTIAKKLDGIVYRYTGNEKLVCDTDENYKKKIIFLEDMIDSFNESQFEINAQVEESNKVNKFHKKFFVDVLPSLADGSINRKDILLMLFSSVLINHIWKENPKAFEWSMENPPENYVEDFDN